MRKKWLFAVGLSLPIILLYAAHFFYKDAQHKPSGLIQWENALYLISAKEYVSGNATILYQYPLDDNQLSPKIFFQPQTFVVGYLWKWLTIDPGLLLSIFGLIFTICTCRIAVEIIDIVVAEINHKKIIAILFCWGGGLLTLAGLILHFLYFKTGTIAAHLFFLDPGNGWWCLNFGRSFIYPLEAYYHFLFLATVLLALKKKFLWMSVIIMVLSISHPYTSVEILLIIITWALLEYFYIRSTLLRKKDLYYIAAAAVFHIAYYGLLNQFEVSTIISRQVALDWSYKAWHFIPAYAIVWLFSFLAVKNIPLLKKQFANPVNRLFFCWGMVAFALSVHGFAIKPVQPLHFTRGYVYAGFFLFAIPAITHCLNLVKASTNRLYKPLCVLLLFVFLVDNISWFASNIAYNNTGIQFTTQEQQLIAYFKNNPANGWIISSEGNAQMATYLQLYSTGKAWIPHPFLTFNMQSKKAAVFNFELKQQVDEQWRKKPSYFFFDKTDTTFRPSTVQWETAFENEQFKVFKIN